MCGKCYSAASSCLMRSCHGCEMCVICFWSSKSVLHQKFASLVPLWFTIALPCEIGVTWLQQTGWHDCNVQGHRLTWLQQHHEDFLNCGKVIMASVTLLTVWFSETDGSLWNITCRKWVECSIKFYIENIWLEAGRVG